MMQMDKILFSLNLQLVRDNILSLLQPDPKAAASKSSKFDENTISYSGLILC